MGPHEMLEQVSRMALETDMIDRRRHAKNESACRVVWRQDQPRL